MSKTLNFLNGFHLKFPMAYFDSTSGHCDAFAVALQQHMQERSPDIETQLIVVQRHRYQMDDDSLVEFNELSHVCLGIHPFERFDSQGGDAVDNWENEWIQPGDGEEDFFEELITDRNGVEELRYKQDQRGIDENEIMRFKQIIELAEANQKAQFQLYHEQQWATDYYQKGGCHELAVALHRQFGLEIKVIQTETYFHVVAVDSNNMAWDSSGITPLDEMAEVIQRKNSNANMTILNILDEKELLSEFIGRGRADTEDKILSDYTENEIERAKAISDLIFKDHPYAKGLNAQPNNKPTQKSPKLS